MFKTKQVHIQEKKVFSRIQFLQNFFLEFSFLTFFENTYIFTPQSLFIVLTFDNLIIQQLTTDHTAYLSKQKYSKFGTSAKREQKIVAGLEIRDRAWASPSALIRRNPYYGVSLTSVPQKNVPSAVLIYYCAQYVFQRDRRYIVVKSNIFVRFPGEFKITKRHFEIN